MSRFASQLIAALVAGAMLFGWGYHRGAASVSVRTITQIDTVFYERPQPYVSHDYTAHVRIPKLLFAPADTVVQVVEVVNGSDSVEVEIPVRTIEYRDSTYYARVSGPVFGGLAPRLDWIETYNRTITQTVTRRNRFAVTAGIGAGYTPQGFAPTLGVNIGVVLWGF